MGKNVQLDCNERRIYPERNINYNNMLFQYTYLLPGFDADFFGGKNAQVAEFIIPVNEAITGKQPALFETLLASQHKFCFSIADNLKQYDKTFIREAIVQNFV